MHEFEAGIIRTEYRGNNTYMIDLSCSEIAREAFPGQFIQVRTGNSTDPFLRRSISVCGAFPERGVIRIMIDVIGHGTDNVCSKKRGASLNIIGPLGKGFDMDLAGSKQCVLVAGGIGAAPLIFLAGHLKQYTNRPVLFMFGARNSEALGIIDELIPDGVEVMTATDDGSSGFHGYVGTLFGKKISKINPGAVFTCGPEAMMRNVARISMKSGVPCQISFEEKMACGLGACYGCVVEHNDGRMLRSCVDGPVFLADEVYT
ncbi:dihydroorotate dehydrogenase electron transfer subunit [Candidatus Latescibacterota bacterium]